MPEPGDSHLPLDREPGPQSLRAAPDNGDGGTGMLLPLMAVLFLACFIAIPVVVISVTEAQGVIYPVLGALAIVFVVAMWLLARRVPLRGRRAVRGPGGAARAAARRRGRGGGVMGRSVHTRR